MKYFLICEVALLLSIVGSLSAECRAPHYRVGRVITNTSSAATLTISIEPEDFVPAKLACLASSLKRAYPSSEIDVSIFSSHEAAVHYEVLSMEYTANAISTTARLHASYHYDTTNKEEYIALIPDALGNAGSFTTRFDLPIREKPTCSLEIQNRCLLQFAHIYGSGSDVKSVTGEVTLSAQIEPNGKTSNVEIVDAHISPFDQQSLVADTMRRNLRTWFFERTMTRESIKLTYSIEPVDKPLRHGVKVSFMLPNRITIETGQ